MAAVAVVVGLGALSAWLLRPAQVARAGALELDPRRIAVLSFDDRSGGRLAYLADGLTAALIERLAGVQSLDVVSLNGVEEIAQDLPVDSAARVLRAGTVVQGSIDPVRGDSVRVTVRLIEGVSGVDFKHATFAGSVSDPLKLRDELAERAADFLRARLGEETRLQARRTDTRSGSAWGLVQQAERVTRDAERLAGEDSPSAADARFLRADSMLAEAERLDARWIEPVVLRGSIAYRRARLEEDRVRAGGSKPASRTRNAPSRSTRGTPTPSSSAAPSGTCDGSSAWSPIPLGLPRYSGAPKRISGTPYGFRRPTRPRGAC
jgi:TolB-like protein